MNEKLTYGEKAVGLTFNPSANPDVQSIKEAFAKAIDECFGMFAKYNSPEQRRMLGIAITEAQAAQMWAVKAITWRDE